MAPRKIFATFPTPISWEGDGGVAMSAELKSRFRASAKICSGVIIILLLVAALGPAQWAPRTELGWQFDHFIGYFGIVLFLCFAWPRPLVVGGIIMAVAASLEALQALTPDRSANLEAALCGAGGALAAALVAGLSIRAYGVLRVLGWSNDNRQRADTSPARFL